MASISETLELLIKATGVEALTGVGKSLDDVGKKAEGAGKSLERPRDELGRFVKAGDEASSGFGGFAGKIGGAFGGVTSAVGGALGGIKNGIGSFVSGVTGAVEAGRQKLSEFSDSASRIGGEMTAKFTLPAVGVGMAMFKITADYQNTMNMLEATSGATKQEMAALGQKAQELGADMELPGTSANDAAEAMFEMVKAGLSVGDAMDSAKGVLQMSAAAQISNAQAAEYTSNALNMFRLNASDATDIANTFAATANASSVDVKDVGDSMKMAGSVFAAQQGPISGTKDAFYDLSTAIGILGNQGIKGSDAGTSLKQALLQLSGPSDKSKAAMQELAHNIGLSGDIAYTAEGKMRPFKEIIENTRKATKDLTDEERNRYITQIYGADASRAIIALMNEGSDGWDKMRASVTKAGSAQALAAAQMKGLKGAMEGLKSQLETVALQFGLKLAPYVEKAIRAIADLIGQLPDLNENLLKGAAAFGAVFASAGPVLSIIGQVGKMLLFVTSPIGMIITAIGLLAAAWVTDFGGIRTTLEPFVNQVIQWFQVFIPQAITFLQSFFNTVLVPAFNTVVQFIATVVVPALEQIGQFIQTVVIPALTEFWNWLNTYIIPALQGFANTVGQAVITFLGQLGNFISGSVIPALQNMWNWFANNILPILNNVVVFIADSVIPKLGDFATYIITNIVPAIQGLWGWFNEHIMPILKDLWQFISDNILPVLGNLATFIINNVVPALAQIFKWAAENVLPVLMNIAGFIADTLKVVLETLANIIGNVLIPAFQNVWQFLSENVFPIFKNIAGFIGDVFKGTIQGLADVWNNVLKPAIDGVGSALKGVADFLTGVFNGLMEGLKTIINGVIEVVNHLIDGINFVGGAFGVHVDKIKKFGEAEDDTRVSTDKLADSMHGLTGQINGAASALLTYAQNAQNAASAPTPSGGGGGKGGGANAKALGGPVRLRGYASGGNMPANPYLVGEKGPELFWPDSNGYVENNASLTGRQRRGSGNSGQSDTALSVQVHNEFNVNLPEGATKDSVDYGKLQRMIEQTSAKSAKDILAKVEAALRNRLKTA